MKTWKAKLFGQTRQKQLYECLKLINKNSKGQNVSVYSLEDVWISQKIVKKCVQQKAGVFEEIDFEYF